MASLNELAPTGRIMNSCMASLLPAWEPPLMMLNAGTGQEDVLPASQVGDVTVERNALVSCGGPASGQRRPGWHWL
jgi:hypothetical protein